MGRGPSGQVVENGYLNPPLKGWHKASELAKAKTGFSISGGTLASDGLDGRRQARASNCQEYLSGA